MGSWCRFAVVMVMLAATACTEVPIDNVERSTFHQPLTLDEATTTIMRAGASLGWEMEVVEPGKIRGSLDLRSHQAVVDISYDTEGFSITYADSKNLDYDEDDDTIHKSYNRWVRNLEREIRSESFK